MQLSIIYKCLASNPEEQQSTSRRHNHHHGPHIGANCLGVVGAAVEMLALGFDLIAELGYTGGSGSHLVCCCSTNGAGCCSVDVSSTSSIGW